MQIKKYFEIPHPTALLRVIAIAVLVCWLPIRYAKPDVITFETTPSGNVPTDNADLSNPYTISAGTVRFFFDTNGDNVYDAAIDKVPKFEKSGDADSGDTFISQFLGNPTRYDTPRPGYASQLGNFMLRKPTTQGNGELPGPFIAYYATSQVITQFSGEIWDIDSGEQWQVDVLSSSGTVLATQKSPVFGGFVNSLDGLPWQFQFTNLPSGVQSVRLKVIAGQTNGVGLAFNNFSPTFAVPLLGDYNRNGIVDAADYVVWRNSVGSATNLAADGNENGVIDSGDYNIWRTNFNRPISNILSETAALVPEQSGKTSCAIAVSILVIGRFRRHL